MAQRSSLQAANDVPARTESLLAHASALNVDHALASRIPAWGESARYSEDAGGPPSDGPACEDLARGGGEAEGRAASPRVSPPRRRDSPIRARLDAAGDVLPAPLPASVPRHGPNGSRYTDAEAQPQRDSDGSLHMNMHRGGAPRPGSSGSDFPLPLRVAPEWAFRGGRSSGGGWGGGGGGAQRHASQQHSKRSEVEAAVAIACVPTRPAARARATAAATPGRRTRPHALCAAALPRVKPARAKPSLTPHCCAARTRTRRSSK
jgi:hypothetical protein